MYFHWKNNLHLKSKSRSMKLNLIAFSLVLLMPVALLQACEIVYMENPKEIPHFMIDPSIQANINNLVKAGASCSIFRKSRATVIRLAWNATPMLNVDRYIIPASKNKTFINVVPIEQVAVEEIFDRQIRNFEDFLMHHGVAVQTNRLVSKYEEFHHLPMANDEDVVLAAFAVYDIKQHIIEALTDLLSDRDLRIHIFSFWDFGLAQSGTHVHLGGMLRSSTKKFLGVSRNGEIIVRTFKTSDRQNNTAHSRVYCAARKPSEQSADYESNIFSCIDTSIAIVKGGDIAEIMKNTVLEMRKISKYYDVVRMVNETQDK